MIRTLETILEKAVDRLYLQATTYVPPLLVALAILAITYAVATALRWSLTRVFKGTALDRILAETGVSSLLGRTEQMRTGPLLSSFVYCGVWIVGLLTALNVFETQLTSKMVEATVFLFPKIATAGVILLVGFWLSRYLGRSLLIWACNEEIPHPRRWASALRVAILFVSVVVAADILDFAARVFLAAFIIGAGSAALAAGLALGLGGRFRVERFLSSRLREPAETGEERSLWNHL